MKKIMILSGFFGLASLLATFELEALPSKASMGECVVKVNDVVNLINRQGNDEAVKQVNEGKFSWKDSYVFIIDMEGL
ncbi:MAG: hypothetical protein HQK54_16665, partial [Oligoflexales bacterium]|nr:hypothetical protein [Oligoflexales bacterium]